MSTISPVKVFTKALSTGTTAVTFNLGGGYKNYQVRVPSMASGGDVRFAVSDDEGTTFRTLYHAPTVATAAPTVVNIPSSVSNAVVNLPPLGQHLQVYLTSATTSSSYIFSIIGIA
jgi:hypothetical protein